MQTNMQTNMQTTGRNEACPCGSGKKYKQCCMQRDSSAAQEKAAQAVSTGELINAAMAHHREGRLNDAEGLYRQVLALEPQNPDALHLLGLIAHQVGQHASAIQMISEAIRIKPSATMYSNFGLACEAMGKRDAAIGSKSLILAQP